MVVYPDLTSSRYHLTWSHRPLLWHSLSSVVLSWTYLSPRERDSWVCGRVCTAMDLCAHIQKSDESILPSRLSLLFYPVFEHKKKEVCVSLCVSLTPGRGFPLSRSVCSSERCFCSHPQRALCTLYAHLPTSIVMDVSLHVWVFGVYCVCACWGCMFVDRELYEYAFWSKVDNACTHR